MFYIKVVVAYMEDIENNNILNYFEVNKDNNSNYFVENLNDYCWIYIHLGNIFFLLAKDHLFCLENFFFFLFFF